MQSKQIQVHFQKPQGVPLFKKFQMFDSGLVPVDRYDRDGALFTRCRTTSLRIDLFVGDRSTDLGNLADGTPEQITYHFEKADQLVGALLRSGVSPYFSWCYVPIALQPPGGTFRSIPVSWEKFQEVFRNFAAHYRGQGSPLGYQEIYNEPINPGVFFDGGVADYNTMYEYGVRGILQGDPDALVGGSAEAFVCPPEECRQNVECFLDYVQAHDLPLDFFSFHSYGFQGKVYLTRTRLMRQALARNAYFNGAGMHLNELNTVPPPWPYRKTILETPALIPQILTCIEDLLEETDVELVHWAQFLESGVDALGLVDRLGRLVPGFYAFELFARMPALRVRAAAPEAYGLMASMDDHRYAALLWNRSDEALPVDLVLDGLPLTSEYADVCVVDSLFLEGLSSDPHLRPQVRLRLPVETGKVRFSGFVLGVFDLVYVECNLPHPDHRINPGFLPGRMTHYYPDRNRPSFAEFDRDSGHVFLGSNGHAGAFTALQLEFTMDPPRPLTYERRLWSGSARLAVRVDYRTAAGYIRSVQFGASSSGSFGRGTDRPPDVIEKQLPDGSLPLSAYAPEGWQGQGMVTFWAEDATADYLETVGIAEAAPRPFGSLWDY